MQHAMQCPWRVRVSSRCVVCFSCQTSHRRRTRPCFCSALLRILDQIDRVCVSLDVKMATIRFVASDRDVRVNRCERNVCVHFEFLFEVRSEQNQVTEYTTPRCTRAQPHTRCSMTSFEREIKSRTVLVQCHHQHSVSNTNSLSTS